MSTRTLPGSGGTDSCLWQVHPSVDLGTDLKCARWGCAPEIRSLDRHQIPATQSVRGTGIGTGA